MRCCLISYLFILQIAGKMPRTFLVERMVDLSSPAKDNDKKFKVADDVTLSCQKQGCAEMQPTERQKIMTSEQQHGAAAMATNVIDYRARSTALAHRGKSCLLT